VRFPSKRLSQPVRSEGFQIPCLVVLQSGVDGLRSKKGPIFGDHGVLALSAMHMPSQQTIKAWSRKAVFWLAVTVVAALVGQFAIALAEERGYYDHPSQKLTAVFDLVLHNPIVWSVGSAILGFALGVWTYSRGQSKEIVSTIQLPVFTKRDSRIAAIAKARKIAAAIRHAVTNRSTTDAVGFYHQFENEAVETKQTLFRALDNIPPVSRNSNAPGAYHSPRSDTTLQLIADDLELLADALEEKLRGIE
jgi:hypothetical protein